jgi:O-antigen/teichoic acid export membrane protein
MAEKVNSGDSASGSSAKGPASVARTADASSLPDFTPGPAGQIRRSPNVAQAVLLGSSLAQLGIALLTTIYLARVLPPSAFGFFALVGTIFILARQFLDLGLNNVAAREIAREPEREHSILEGMMAYRRVAGLPIALGLLIFASTQANPLERWILVATGIVLLFTEPAALDPVFQVRQAQGGPALLNVMAGLFVLCGSVLLKRFEVAASAFAFLLVAREALILLITKLLAGRLLRYRLRPGFRERNLRAFVAPALIFGLASLVYTIYFHCDVFFVYALRGKDELGAYAAAFRPLNPLLLMPWLLMMPMLPVLTATAAKDRELFVRQVRGACRLAAGLGACGLVAGVVLAPDLIQLLYRGRYLTGPLSCVAAFQWLALALGQVCVTTVLTTAMLADRQEKTILAIGVSALTANVAVNLIVLHFYNFTAAAFTTALSELLFLVSALVAFQVITRRSALTWETLTYLIPALLLGAILHFLGGGPGFRVICGIVLGSGAVAGILFSQDARRFRAAMATASPTF